MVRTPLIAANWKMHKGLSEAAHFVKEFLPRVEKLTGLGMVLCPPFTALGAVGWALSGHKRQVGLGAQNLYKEAQGAFTGEISAAMLTDLGCSYVIVGHSERRHLFGESDQLVGEKVEVALGHGLTPILCVGETMSERESGRTDAITRSQVLIGTEGLNAEQAKLLVIAYEPVWAIGTGKSCNPSDAQVAIAAIRQVLSAKFGPDVGAAIRIQYGGSVKPSNILEYMALPDIDGALVGGASLEPESFAAICAAAAT